MTRLYLHIYLAFLAILVMTVVAAAVLGAILHDEGPPRRVWIEGFASIVGEGLPAGATPADLETILEEHAREIPLDFALWDGSGLLLASTGASWPATPIAQPRGRRIGPQTQVRLDDGRTLGIRVRRSPRRSLGFLGGLLWIAGAIAVGAYPLARRITRRLESLRHGVEAFGAGDLGVRVAVPGRDEVASVAAAFNQSANRIQELVESERRLVANASHEFRSPLARLRVAVELLREPSDRSGLIRHADEAARNIEELDALVGDLLLGSRLAAAENRDGDPRLDLTALVEEVCEREGVAFRGQPAFLRGDAKSLRRMLRNLIDNAVQHGGGDVEVTLSPGPPHISLRVSDRGTGIATAERERVFEPFYRGETDTAPEDRGAGLGLSLVRQIARYHGGDARVLAREGGGCVFEVSLTEGED